MFVTRVFIPVLLTAFAFVTSISGLTEVLHFSTVMLVDLLINASQVLPCVVGQVKEGPHSGPPRASPAGDSANSPLAPAQLPVQHLSRPSRGCTGSAPAQRPGPFKELRILYVP